VDEITKRSPLALVLAIAAATPAVVGAVWGVVQIVEKVSNWRLNRRKLIAEVKKLEANAEAKHAQLTTWNEETFHFLLEHRGAIRWYYQVQERLVKSPIKIVKTEIVVKRSIITIGNAEK